MPAISTSFSAAAKPFYPESDSRILFLIQKFIFLEQLQIQAMQSKNSALLLQIQTSFNLLFKEQMIHLSASDMLNSSVSEFIFPSSKNSTQPQIPTINSNLVSENSSNQKFLTPRQSKKQERGAQWKFKKLSKANSDFPNYSSAVVPTISPSTSVSESNLSSAPDIFSSIASVISLSVVPDNPQRNVFCSSPLFPIKSRRPPVSTIPPQPHVSTTFVESILIPFIPLHKREFLYELIDSF